jgi:hypothetical protein
VPPSPRRCHPTGRLYRLADGSPDLTAVPVITPAERGVLLDAARGLNRWVEPEPQSRPAVTGPRPGNGDRPGDDFDRRATWAEVLEPHGWTFVRSAGDEEFWCRPEKSGGINATVNYAGAGLLHVFSSNALPFEQDRSYGKFAAYTLLNHGGDYVAAARALQARGFGRQSGSGITTLRTITLGPVGQRGLDPVILADDEAELVRIRDEAAPFTGGNPGEVEQVLTEEVSWARSESSRPADDFVPGNGYRPVFLTSAELDALNVSHTWLVKKVLVSGQPALVGGPKKCLKTSILVDLALSLGSGTPFLGKFDVPRKVRVAVLSGESGEVTVRETAQRVARTRDVRLADCDVMWGFDLPRLGVPADVAALVSALRAGRIEVVIIDPAYLCLLAGSPELQANNMFQTGPILSRIAVACRDVGATLVLAHHTKKENAMQRTMTGEPLELDDLAYAGFQEFARQWLLVNRRVRYEPGTGSHRLWLNVGGSAGHSGLWGLDVDEGQLGMDFGGRRWSVRVLGAEEARKAARREKEDRKDAAGQAKQEANEAAVVKALEMYPTGETQAVIATATGLQPKVVGPILAKLLQQGTVVSTQVEKPGGKGKKPYDAWRLATSNEKITRMFGGTTRPAVPEAPVENDLAAVATVVKRKGLADDPEDTDWLDDQVELTGESWSVETASSSANSATAEGSGDLAV